MIFPPVFLARASSWSIIPYVVERTMWPNPLEGSTFWTHCSTSVTATSNLGEITPHLLSLPFNSNTIFPDLWSSIISNSPIYPCLYITFKNFIKTFETGCIITYFFPYLSAAIIVFKQSARTLTLIIIKNFFFKF